MPTQFGGFNKVLYPDASGVQQEISAYVTTATIPRNTNAVDVTAFPAGGGRTPAIIKRGAVQSALSLTVLLDPVSWAIAQQKAGDPAGGLLWIQSGQNASPTFGDEQFQGTFTLLQVDLNLSFNAAATMTWTFAPTDGGAVAPGYVRI